MTDLDVSQNARTSIRKGSKSFAMAARFFEPDIREDAVRLYAWCRLCDDVIDGQDSGYDLGVSSVSGFTGDASARLEQLRERTNAALTGRPCDHPAFQGLASIAANCNLDPRHPDALLDGFAMDVERRDYETLADTLDYGYHVAGVVGVMMAHLMGVRDASILDRASDLGIAFQLTNITRDIYEDAAADRVYIPRAILRDAGAPVLASEIIAEGTEESVHRAAIALLDIAEEYYTSARIGMAYLPARSRMAIVAAALIYREIGEEIRRRDPSALRARTFTSAPKKTELAFRAAFTAPFYKKQPEAQREEALYQRPV